MVDASVGRVEKSKPNCSKYIMCVAGHEMKQFFYSYTYFVFLWLVLAKLLFSIILFNPRRAVVLLASITWKLSLGRHYRIILTLHALQFLPTDFRPSIHHPSPSETNSLRTHPYQPQSGPWKWNENSPTH